MLSGLVALLVAVVPGLLLGFCLPAGRDRWTVWASSPVLTLGLAGVAMGWLQRAGVANGAVPVLVAELALGGLAALLAWGWRRRRHVTARAGVDPSADPSVDATAMGDLAAGRRARWWSGRRLDLVAFGVSGILTVGATWLLLGRWLAPVGWDAMNHGFLTRRILDTDSSRAVDVCVSGVVVAVEACGFYPLAANVEWAQTSLLSGATVSASMYAWALVVAPLAVTAAVYVLVRRLGGSALVAGAASTTSALLGAVWLGMYMGRLTEFAGPGLAIPVALLAVLALTSDRPRMFGALAGLGAVGILLSHSYDIVLVVVLALAVTLVSFPRRLGLRTLWGALSGVVVAVVGVLPFLQAILAAGGPRESREPIFPGQLDTAIGFFVTSPQNYVLYGYPTLLHKQISLGTPVKVALALTLAGVLLSPLSFVLRELRWARPWIVAWLVVMALGVWTTYDTGSTAQGLAGLWYGNPDRVKSMVRPFIGVIAVAGVCVAAVLVEKLVRRVVRRGLPRWMTPLTGPAVWVWLAVIGLCALTPAAWKPIRDDFSHRVQQGPSYERTYDWLAQNLDPGKTVAYDRHLQFMTWSYADDGVTPLFGIPPLEPRLQYDYRERMATFKWLAGSKSKSNGCMVDRFKIQYLVVGGPNFPTWTQHYNEKSLAKSTRVDLVRQDGPIRVYEVNSTGSACAR